MNFGNPQKPEIMGQFAGAIMGMAEACKALDFPVVSGNVSLYNETEGRPILPTPTIGAVGVIDDIANAVGSRLTQAGLAIVLIGETKGWLGQSLYLRETLRPRGRRAAAGRPCGRAAQRRLRARPDRRPAASPPATTCRDGGLLVGLAEMCLAGGTGVTVQQPAGTAVPSHAFLYGEDQARYLIDRRVGDDVLEAAQAAGVPAVLLGYSGGAVARRRRAGSRCRWPRSRQAHEDWLPDYMNSAE